MFPCTSLFTAPSWHGNLGADQVDPALRTCTHVYVLNSAVKPPLTRPYRGPFKVLRRGDKVFTIQLPNGSEDTVSIDRLKPAFVATDVVSPAPPPPPTAPPPRTARPPTPSVVVPNPQQPHKTVQCRTPKLPQHLADHSYFSVPLQFAAFQPSSSSELHALQVAAGALLPLLDNPEFPDDQIHMGPLLPL